MDFKKEMRGFFVHSVCLPEKVTESFTGLSDRVLELKRKNGSTCHVGLIASGGKLILQPGWNNFISANGVSQNDLLIFKFMGGSKFEVQIFDPTGCEKINDPMKLVTGTKTISLEPVSGHVEESDEVKTKLPLIKGWPRNHCKLRQKRQRKDCRKLSYNEEKEEKLCDKLNNNKKEMRLHQSYLGEKEELHEIVPGLRTDTTKEQSKILGKRVAPSNEGIYHPQKIVLSAKQKRRFKQLASKAQARNPAFLKVMTRVLTRKCRINIPMKFAAEQLPKATQFVVLRRPKKEMTWQVNYYYSKRVQTIAGSLWRKFVQENNLQDGDMCLFEMVKAAEQITFLVHISKAI